MSFNLFLLSQYCVQKFSFLKLKIVKIINFKNERIVTFVHF